MVTINSMTGEGVPLLVVGGGGRPGAHGPVRRVPWIVPQSMSHGSMTNMKKSMMMKGKEKDIPTQCTALFHSSL